MIRVQYYSDNPDSECYAATFCDIDGGEIDAEHPGAMLWCRGEHSGQQVSFTHAAHDDCMEAMSRVLAGLHPEAEVIAWSVQDYVNLLASNYEVASE